MKLNDKYMVRSIDNEQCKEWLLKKHYLKRNTSYSYAFGLFDNNFLVGICTFGNAVPMQMKKSICGDKYMELVYELNRLCTNDNLDKNANSFFLARCFMLLPKPLIIVSYADKSFGHHGYIYQASNFYFTGESHIQFDWKVKGKEHIHIRTLLDEFAFEEDRVNKLKEKYGDELYRVQREPKYRYVYFLGNKKQKKEFLNNKLFDIKPYPKGDNKYYDSSYNPNIQGILF